MLNSKEKKVNELLQKHEFLLQCVLARLDMDQNSVVKFECHRDCLDETDEELRLLEGEALLTANTYKKTGGSAQYRFGVLEKIIKYLSFCYLDGQDRSLTITEILADTKLLGIEQPVKDWLVTAALYHNPKIQITNINDCPTYKYKPIYSIKDGDSLICLLKENGINGVLLENVRESLPNYEEVLKAHASEIITITTKIDHKTVLFYNDKSLKVQVNAKLQKIHTSEPVPAVSKNKLYVKKARKLYKENIAPRLAIKQKVPLNKKEESPPIVLIKI